MLRIAALILSFMMLQSCAVSQQGAPPNPQPGLYGDGSGHGRTDGLRARGDRAPHAGQWAVAVVGTPVYLAFKTVVCGASLVVAAPSAAVIALSDSPYVMGVDQLGDGVAANCGPPYVLSPI